MKIKLLLIVVIITTSLVTISCSKNTIGRVDKVVGSIVIDEDTKKTTNNKNEIKTTLIAKTEKVKSSISTANGKIASYNFTVMYGEDKPIDLPRYKLDELKIGTITDEKNENGLNKISWENKNITGRLLTQRMTGSETRILDNNKVYKIDISGELKEIKAYEKLEKENADSLYDFRTYADGTLDMYCKFGEPGKIKTMSIIDVENDKYFEINGDVLDVLTEKRYELLAVEDGKIYVRLDDEFTGDMTTTVGYFENNIYTEVFSTTDTINMETKGDMIYSNGRILFSGIAENKNNIWNYDIENKKLVSALDLSGSVAANLYLNKEKNKIIIGFMDYVNEKNIRKFSIAEIDKNLEISSLTNIVSSGNETGYYQEFSGWSDDGNKFYLYLLVLNTDTEKSNYNDVYYEVYKIEN